jgi:predicted ArsR family transcriptional regulator
MRTVHPGVLGAGAGAPTEGGTRDGVSRLLLECGPLTAVALAQRLELSAAAIRRHLDGLLERGLVVQCVPRGPRSRGRGRPAKAYTLTDKGRAAFPHAYDDLASTAMRYLQSTGGPGAVRQFAQYRADELAERLQDGMTGQPTRAPAERLADALSAEGYAASAETTGSGTQLCQHHCPVAHVAAEFAQLCEAETRAFERLLGTHVQRLATIANGDGVCTTFVPATRPDGRLTSAAGSALPRSSSTTGGTS